MRVSRGGCALRPSRKFLKCSMTSASVSLLAFLLASPEIKTQRVGFLAGRTTIPPSYQLYSLVRNQVVQPLDSVLIKERYIETPYDLQIPENMQLSQHNKTPFSSYRLKTNDLTLLHAIPSPRPELKAEALVLGCLKRKELRIYKGNGALYDDLQIVLDHDREHSPNYLKIHNIAVNSDVTGLLPQCIDCGKFNSVFKFCEQCEHAHYCSEGCFIRAKLNHQRQCRPRTLPSVSSPLQVQLHIGSDLGHSVEVHFQHELRTSLQTRGERIITSLFEYFNDEGKPLIHENYTIQLINKHFRYKMVDQTKYSTLDKDLTVDSLDKAMQLYKNNPMVGHIELFLYRRGAILAKEVKEVHNNHFHIVFVFLCCY